MQKVPPECTNLVWTDLGLFGLVSLRKRRMDEIAEATRAETQGRGRSDV
jgi:hypothetical protein